MIFDAWAITDYKFRYGQRPGHFFIKTILDKFVYKFHMGKFHGEVVDDTHYIHDNTKAYLSLFRY
jgi:hypothetical protein